MPKRLIKRILPGDNHQLKNSRSLRLLGRYLQDANLWHLNRHSAARAFSVGFFCAFVPLPMQTLLAVLFAFLIRANLPLSIALVWISNPLTMGPLFYFAYKIGASLLLIPPQHDKWAWSWDLMWQIWQPLVFGTLLCGLISAIASNVIIRLLWRWSIIRKWRARRSQ